MEVYSGVDKVRLYLDDKLIGEKPTGRSKSLKRRSPLRMPPGH